MRLRSTLSGARDKQLFVDEMRRPRGEPLNPHCQLKESGRRGRILPLRSTPQSHRPVQTEPFPRVRARKVSRRDGLESHDASQAAMAGAIHDALASAAQFAQKFVVAENWWRRGLP